MPKKKATATKTAKSQRKEAPSGQTGFFDRIKLSFTAPDTVFREVKEENVRQTFYYYAALLLFWMAASTVVDFLVLKSGVSLGAAVIGVLALWLIVLFVSSAVGTAVSHLFVLLFGGKKGYLRTYKAIVYSSTPYLLLGWIPLLGMVLWIWVIYNQIKGYVVLQEMPVNKAVLAAALPLIVILLLFLAALYRLF